MNDFFSNAVVNLGIKGYQEDCLPNIDGDNIISIINKFKSHPSILKIKERVKVNEKFSFSICSIDDIANDIHKLII